MELITTLLMTYLPMYAPAIVAILAIVAAVIPYLVKAHEALKAFKESQELRDIIKQLKEQSAENKELARCNKLLLDKITKIQGYADAKKNEED